MAELAVKCPSSTGMDRPDQWYQGLLDIQLVKCWEMPSGSESAHNMLCVSNGTQRAWVSMSVWETRVTRNNASDYRANGLLTLNRQSVSPIVCYSVVIQPSALLPVSTDNHTISIDYKQWLIILFGSKCQVKHLAPYKIPVQHWIRATIAQWLEWWTSNPDIEGSNATRCYWLERHWLTTS